MAILKEIEKISLELILCCLQKQKIIRTPILFQKIEMGTVLMRVGNIFSVFFHALYRIHALKSLDPVQFGHTSIRICLKLSRNPDPFHTVLACAFLIEYIVHQTKRRECFKVVFVAWKCLAVLLNRRLGNVLEDPTRWEAFKLCTRDLYGRVNLYFYKPRAIAAVCRDPNTIERTLVLIDDCKEFDEEIDLSPEEIHFVTNKEVTNEEVRAERDFIALDRLYPPILVHLCKTCATEFAEDYGILR